jgi:hypothetical protein
VCCGGRPPSCCTASSASASPPPLALEIIRSVAAAEAAISLYGVKATLFTASRVKGENCSRVGIRGEEQVGRRFGSWVKGLVSLGQRGPSVAQCQQAGRWRPATTLRPIEYRFQVRVEAHLNTFFLRVTSIHFCQGNSPVTDNLFSYHFAKVLIRF